LPVFFSSSAHRLAFADLAQTLHQKIVLVRCSHAYTKVIFEHWIATNVANQNVALQQLFKYATRRYHRTDCHEVRSRCNGTQSGNTLELGVQALSLADDR